jgi:orotate phosphoribosyltransferase-like protein
MGFIEVSASNPEDYVIGFNSSGVPIATKTISGGTF